MGFTKEFFEMIVKTHGNTSIGGSEVLNTPDIFFYLYFKDMTESDGYGAYEEDKFSINPLDGVLEIVELEIEQGNDISRVYVPYENIIRFSVGTCHGTDQ